MKSYKEQQAATEAAILRLPKHIREYIERCQRREAEAQKTLAEYRDSKTKSLAWTTGASQETRNYIQDDRIYFDLGIGQLMCVVEGNELRITSLAGDSILSVRPWVTNVVVVELRERT